MVSTIALPVIRTLEPVFVRIQSSACEFTKSKSVISICRGRGKIFNNLGAFVPAGNLPKMLQRFTDQSRRLDTCLESVGMVGKPENARTVQKTTPQASPTCGVGRWG